MSSIVCDPRCISATYVLKIQQDFERVTADV